MSFSVQWGNETKTIILITLNAGWTWADMEESSVGYTHLMNSVEHRVHLIFYATEDKTVLPPDALGNIPRLMRLTHPREDQTVIVGRVPLIKNIMGIIHKVYGLREIVENYHFVDTLDEAYQLLARIDAEKLRII